MPTTHERTAPLAEAVLSLAIIELTLTTAYIHLRLGSTLFTLNGVGYLALAAGIGISTFVRTGPIGRLAWLVRPALAPYATATIGGYLVLGPYFARGWIAKAVEVAILTLLAADWALRGWRARPDSNRRSPA